MGLGDLVDESNQTSKAERQYRSFSHHEYEDKVEEWVDELQHKFPEEVRVDFVEISPKMSKTSAKAYWRGQHQYLRVAEWATEKYTDYYLKEIVLHEMVHLYFRQIGKGEVSDNSRLFNWVLGQVGADLSGTSPGHWQYDIMEKFKEQQ